MSCSKQYQKSSLNAYTATTQAATTGTLLQLNTIGEQSGASIDFTAGSTSVVLSKPGLYYVTVNVVAADSGTTGNATLTIARNGTAIPGSASTVYMGETTDIMPLHTEALVTVNQSCQCVNNTATLTFVNAGIAVNITNVSVNIFKLA